MRNVAWLFIAFLLVACEQSTFGFDTVDDARKAKMFEKGWLPSVLPETAEHISITTEVDVGRCSGSFFLPEADLVEFQSQLSSEPLSFRYDAWRDEIERMERDGREVLYYRSDRATFAFSCERVDRSCEFMCG